ncbi:MAG: cobalamin-dependent protein, partial [Kiritimatiellales bacterium]
MDIVFSTFNARYSHTSLSLRCLRANLGSLHDRSVIVEFDNSISPQLAAEKLLVHSPRVVLFSVYIWNLVITYETALILKSVRPDLNIVVGGPEVSYDYEDSLTVQLADHLIRGEGESVIEAFCRDLLDGKQRPKIINAHPADLNTVALPYDE